MAQGPITLFDHAKMFDAEGNNVLPVVNILSQTNPIINDAVVIESNSDSGHKYAIQTGMPEVAWRRAYEGVDPSKATQRVVNETYGRASTLTKVDVAIADKGGHSAQVRASAAAVQLEAMSQEMANKIINGSIAEDEKSFVGLAARYSSTNAESARNLILAGGSSNLSSIYLVGWAKDKIFGFYPKGTKAGIQIYDYNPDGKPHKCVDENGKTFPGYETQYEWLMGLGVQDWRYGARIANIDVTDLNTKAKCAALFDKFMEAVNSIQNLNGINLVAYASRKVKFALRNGFLAAGGNAGVIQTAPQVQQANNLSSSGNSGYSSNDLVIDGIHVKAEDAIKNGITASETLVS